MIAEIFSAPLFLNWYKVSIVNNSKYVDPNCIESQPPIIRFTFLKGDPRKYQTNLTDGEFVDGISIYTNAYPSYHMKSGDKIFFLAPSNEQYSINGGLMFSGDCNLQFPIENVEQLGLGKALYDYQILVQPYWKSWLVRFGVIVIFWLFLLSSIVSLIQWWYVKK